MKERKNILSVFILVVIFSIVGLNAMLIIQPYLIEHNHYILSFNELLTEVIKNKAHGYIIWYLGEFSETMVMRTVLGSLLGIIFAIIGYYLERKNSKYRGTDIVGGTGYFFEILIFSAISVLISDILFHSDTKIGWIPTFISVCCIVPTFIPKYGYKKFKGLTIVLLAGIIPYPIAKLAIIFFTNKYNMPRCLAGLIGILFATIIAEEIVKFMPWMTINESVKEASMPRKVKYGKRFFLERLLADPNEMGCWGSSYAAVGIYIGTLFSWVLNPNSTSCVEGRFPIVFWCQILAVAVSIFIYYPIYIKGKNPLTFTSYITIAALINTYEISWIMLIVYILIISFLTPALAMFFNNHIKRWSIAVPVLLSIILVASILSVFIKYVTL